MKRYERSLKNFGKGLKSVAITAFGFAISPYAFPIGALGIVKGANGLYKSLQGNYVEDSMMMVQKNRVINKMLKQPNYYIGEGIPSLKQFLEATISKDKMNFLKLQEFNLLQGLDLKDEKGNKIMYNTTTHAGNYRLLMQLQKSGMIEKLSKTPYKESALLLEKAFIANNKSKAKDKEYKKQRISEIKERVKEKNGIFSKFKTLKEELDVGVSKKTQMYKVSFEKSEKEFDLQNVQKLLPFIFDESGKIKRDKYNVIYDKNGNVKGVDYTNKYIMQELKNRAKNLTKDKSKEVSSFMKNLKEQTRSSFQIGLKKEGLNEINIKNKQKDIESVER